MATESIEQFCHAMPKIELHAHLNTSFDTQTLQQLVARKAKTNQEILSWSLSIADYKEMDDSFYVYSLVHKIVNDEDAVYMSDAPLGCFFPCSLRYALSFNVFKLIHKVVDDEEAVYKLMMGTLRSFAADNVKYVELRSTPKEIPATGMTRELYVRTMLRAIRDCQEQNLDIIVYLLLSIDRRHGVEVGQLTVDLAEKFKEESNGVVIGIDFSGDPAVGDAADFIPVFLSAKKKGLKVAAHLAELANFEETLAVLRQAPPDRIGHGTFLHRYEAGQGHEEIEEIVLTKQIPIEACMTSNLKTKTVTEYSEHHFNFWFQKKHPVILCTDGTGVYMTSLSHEYAHAASTFNFSKQDLWHLSLASIDSIFAPERVKTKLKERWQAAWPRDS